MTSTIPNTPQWMPFRDAFIELEGKSLWVTAGGLRLGPLRIAIVPNPHPEAAREYAVQLISGMPDDGLKRYLTPAHVGALAHMGDDEDRFMELQVS